MANATVGLGTEALDAGGRCARIRIVRRRLVVTLAVSVPLVVLGLSFTRCAGVFGSLGVRGMGGGPLPALERFVGGATEGEGALPLLVALHGRGSDHERFAAFFAGLRTPARVLSIGAPVPEHDGRAWFTFGRGWGGAVDDLDACVPRILRTIDAARDAHSTAGRPVVVGFSQGAMLAYLLALRHPTAIGAAFPVSGISVDSLQPADLDPSLVPPIHAFHGTNDEIIAIHDSRESVARLRSIGVGVDLTEVPGATHWIGTEVSAVLLPGLDQALAAEAR